METTMRALVLDDNELLGKSVGMTLRMKGHEVVIESSPFDAMARLESEQFDLVISDYNAGPGPNGVEVLKAARRHSPNAIRILMSGNTESEIGDMDGATFLPKPFGAREILASISS